MVLAGNALCYEVVIIGHPSTDPISVQQLVDAKPVHGKTTLIEFLGGADKIKKVVLGKTANKDLDVLNASVVLKRFADFVCMDAKKNEWMFAPFAVGTIYFVDGKKQSFVMGVERSGITIAGHLFAPPKKAETEHVVGGNGG